MNWSPTVKLAASDMGEPMAPPVGYSVQIAQGTGLGDVVAHTGTTVAEEEITHDGLEISPQDVYVPPPVKKNDTPASHGDFDEPDIFIPAAPNQSQTSSVTGTTSKSGDGAASLPPVAPSAPPAAPTPPSKADSKSKDDDDDGKDNRGSSDQPSSAGQSGSSGGGQPSSSYRDLAARFENLKNL